jgi:hypothetical protein
MSRSLALIECVQYSSAARSQSEYRIPGPSKGGSRRARSRIQLCPEWLREMDLLRQAEPAAICGSALPGAPGGSTTSSTPT